MKRHSIKWQLALSFAGLIAVALGLNLLINNLFLEKYYIQQKKEDLVEIYNEINHVEDVTDYQSDDFEESFRKVSRTANVELSILWIDSTGSAYTVYQSRDNSAMRGRIWMYLFGTTENPDASVEVLEQTENFRIQKITDNVEAADYLEGWGKLDNGCFFLLRIPVQSIRESVRISNSFTSYILAASILVSMLFVWWISRRISSPIQELTALSSRMANLDFNAKYTSGGNNEIGELGENFNHMSETLEQTISELKTANNELKNDIEKKTQIDEMRKEFLSNVSHELKTPIALIQGYAEGLQECINDDEQSREFYCDVIMDEAGKMNNMVKKLLTLNQLEFGNDVVNMERFDLTELLRGVISSSRLLAEQKEAQIIFAENGPQYVWGDEFKVEEVVTNYVSNAINHVFQGGRIEIVMEQREGKIRTSVSNTGNPIPEEELDKIWIKFYKVDKARTREYGGSGIGLSIVKAIMESMNQQFGVYNRPDGVCFWFELEKSS